MATRIRTFGLFRASTLTCAVLTSAVSFVVGCSTPPPPAPAVDPIARENAIFACKQQMQAAKKERFAKLPKILQRLAGENQALKEFDKPPSKADIQRAIAKFPLIGDSGGTWNDGKEAAQRTVSTRFVSKPEEAMMISIVFGQPGRVYDFPLSKLKGTVSGGLAGKNEDDVLKIRSIDESHVLVEATTNPKSKLTKFYARNTYAVVRTYVEQTYSQETASQLPDYPIDAHDLMEDTCDQHAIVPN